MNDSQNEKAHFAGALLAAGQINCGRQYPDGQVLDGFLPMTWQETAESVVFIGEVPTAKDVGDMLAAIAEGYVGAPWPDQRSLEELIADGLL